MLSIYRLTIVISTILWLILLFLPYFDLVWYTEDEINLLAWDGWNRKLVMSNATYWFICSLWLSSSITLFFTVKYSREFFLFLVCSTTLVSFFWGFRVFAPIENVLAEIITMADGAIIYMAYFSSISQRFNNDS